jgi:NADH-quinone oxidoreductase subunit H
MTWGEGLRLSAALFALFNVLAMVVMSLVWLERKQLGRMQGRVGPTRVGPFGLLQPFADALKLLMKEDVAPGSSQRVLFFVAPLMVFVPAFVVWLTIPFFAADDPDGTQLVIRNFADTGLFFFVAISVLGIVGLVLAGWSSNSKYAVLGSFRAAAQLVSYEIPIIMAILVAGMLAGSLDFIEVVNAQDPVPYAVIVPLAFAVFLVAGMAEVGRTPFDIYTAESEVVGGPFVEYSGAHWAIFFLAEYINTFVIGIIGAILFLGGWRWPFDDPPMVAGVALLVGKAYLIVIAIFWVRATYPRLRIDQLMALGWKWLIPLSFAAVVATSFQLFYDWPQWVLTVLSLAILITPIWLQLRLQRKPAVALAKRYDELAVLVQAKPRPQAPPPAEDDAPGAPGAPASPKGANA